eukprot:6463789-Amphidinium_carterae.1
MNLESVPRWVWGRGSVEWFCCGRWGVCFGLDGRGAVWMGVECVCSVELWRVAGTAVTGVV